MRCKIRVILLSLISNVLTQQQLGICSQGDPIECCWNYKLVENVCAACTPGTFGENCEEECPTGLYGQFCKENCSCDPCDKVTGCLNKKGKESQQLGNALCQPCMKWMWQPLKMCMIIWERNLITF